MRTLCWILPLVLFTYPAGAACQLPRPRLVCAEYFQSKAVVIAKLAGITPVKDGYGDLTGTYYSMTVERSFRGQVDRLFRVYETTGSAHARFDWKTGESYLLFLHERDPDGRWLIDGCGNSGPLETTTRTLQQVDAIDSTSSHALIQGAVWDYSIPGPVPGAQVEARGPGGLITAKTQEDGRFEMRVAPGKYQLRAQMSGKSFVADEFSYENPDKLVLENSGCVQVQFVEASQRH